MFLLVKKRRRPLTRPPFGECCSLDRFLAEDFLCGRKCFRDRLVARGHEHLARAVVVDQVEAVALAVLESCADAVPVLLAVAVDDFVDHEGRGLLCGGFWFSFVIVFSPWFVFSLAGMPPLKPCARAQRHTGKLGETFRGNRGFLLTRQAPARGRGQGCTEGEYKRLQGER